MLNTPKIELREDKIGLYLYSENREIYTMEYMLAAIKILDEDKTLPRELRILEVALDSVATFNIHDVKVLYRKMKEVAEGYTYIKHAVVHNSKINTAFGLFVEHLTKNKRFELRVFSSISAAEKRLLVTGSANI